jgi:hypothetical protein
VLVLVCVAYLARDVAHIRVNASVEQNGQQLACCLALLNLVLHVGAGAVLGCARTHAHAECMPHTYAHTRGNGFVVSDKRVQRAY